MIAGWSELMESKSGVIILKDNDNNNQGGFDMRP